jgi:hypothetical protein
LVGTAATSGWRCLRVITVGWKILPFPLSTVELLPGPKVSIQLTCSNTKRSRDGITAAYSTVSTGIFFLFPFLFYLEGVPYPILRWEFNKSPATYFCSRKLSVSSFRWSRRFSVFLLVFSVGLVVGVEPHRPRLGSPLLILPIIKRKFYLPHGLRSAWRQPLLLCLVQSQFQRITLVPPHIVMYCAWNKKKAEIKEGAAGQREKKSQKKKTAEKE